MIFMIINQMNNIWLCDLIVLDVDAHFDVAPGWSLKSLFHII